jgi:predicted nucleotide-binding protein (sugar kinase/HSP70/actin superfamily)
MYHAASTPSLTGRQLYLPRMSDCGAELLAAAFRSAGLDATVLPAPDARTLELGARHLTGDECLPAKVTLGDFLRLVEAPGFRPEKAALFMPGSEGPCRLGQYGPQIRNVLRHLGYRDVLLISPTDGDGYRQAGTLAPDLMRTAWRGMVISDLLRKLVLKTRPYECVAGDADHAYAAALQRLCDALETAARSPRAQLRRLVDDLVSIRDRFRAIPTRNEYERPLIGIQGELFCRMEDFSNGHLIRCLEACGAEAWLSDISEWIWYSNSEEEQRLRHSGHRLSRPLLKAKLRDFVQRADQHALLVPFVEDFRGYEDTTGVDELLRAGYPYLPYTCTEGEMVLSAGKVEYFFRRGVDGIIDVSPFSCMNGIVSEALYPRLSQDHAGLPIKNVYVDGTGRDLTSELEIFLELARAYQINKPHARRYPAIFRERQAVLALAGEPGLAPTFSLAS